MMDASVKNSTVTERYQQEYITPTGYYVNRKTLHQWKNLALAERYCTDRKILHLQKSITLTEDSTPAQR